MTEKDTIELLRFMVHDSRELISIYEENAETIAKRFDMGKITDAQVEGYLETIPPIVELLEERAKSVSEIGGNDSLVREAYDYVSRFHYIEKTIKYLQAVYKE